MEDIRNEAVEEETEQVEGEVFEEEVEPTKLEKMINFAKRNKSKIVTGLAIVASAVIGYSIGSSKESETSDVYPDLTIHVLGSEDNSGEEKESDDSEENSSEE